MDRPGPRVRPDVAREGTEEIDREARPVSRAPVVVVVGGLLLALGLVVLGARLAAVPAPRPDLSSPGTPAEPRAVNVILRDYAFDPNPLYLVAGETVRLNVLNGGLVEHELVLGDAAFQRAWAAAHAAATPPGPFATRPPVDVAVTAGGARIILPSGGSSSVTYDVPRDTALAMMCHLPGHVERGMVGQVEFADR